MEFHLMIIIYMYVYHLYVHMLIFYRIYATSHQGRIITMSVDVLDYKRGAVLSKEVRLRKNQHFLDNNNP